MWLRSGGLGGSREDLAKFCISPSDFGGREATTRNASAVRRLKHCINIYRKEEFRCLCWRLYKIRGRIENSEPGINSCFSCSTSCLARFTSLAPLESRLVIGQLYALHVFWLVIDASYSRLHKSWRLYFELAVLYAVFLEAMPQEHVLKDALFFLAHHGDRKALVQGKCISNEGVKSRG